MNKLRGIQALGKLERITKDIADLQVRLEREGDTPALRERMDALRQELETLRGRLRA